MKDTSFRSRFSLLVRLAWGQVCRAETLVEALRASENKQDESVESEDWQIELEDIIVKEVEEEKVAPKINLKMIPDIVQQ